MITYYEANQIRLALKMRLSRYHWFSSSYIDVTNSIYIIVVDVKKINKFVKQQVPGVINGVKVRLDLERSRF